MNPQETLKGNLRFLIASTSSEEVYNTLTQIFKEDYAFLQKIYGKVEPPKRAMSIVIDTPNIIPSGFPSPVVLFHPPVIVPAQEQEVPKIRADTKVRIVKKPTSLTDLPPAVIVSPLVASPALPASTSAPVTVHTESGLRDPKDIKKWQKEQEDKKASELRAAGINPISLLTEVNMRKWVVDEKKTFAAIARDYVGLSDVVIASEAKKYGIQSDIAKRRAAIIGSKKAK
jgi:hypothetical protein